MNGATALLHTLTGSGVDTCFMNPGTSEMHFVAALDEVPEMRGVLALFEGVATGAADGFGRMTGRPAAALLHLGPGLGNGIANLHNARRAHTPLVAVVGDHATYHKRFDAPLESDIDALASNVSGWVRRPAVTGELARAASAAVAASYGPPGRVATLILPADVSWSDGATPAAAQPITQPAGPEPATVAEVAAILRTGREPVAFLAGGHGCRAGALATLVSISEATGARVITETFPARIERGAGRVAPPRLAYLGEMAQAQLDGLAHLVLVGARAPVSFFAYPGKPSDLVPAECRVYDLAPPGTDVDAALRALASEVPSGPPRALAPRVVPAGGPDGDALTPEAVGRVIGRNLPEGAVVAEEAITSGLPITAHTAGAPPHDWLTVTGGAIGVALPLAVGAAVACPGRRVLALESDGSAMYCLQALWTMAREGLDVVSVILSNRSYAILNMELSRVGATAGGPRARRMLDLHDPELDFAALARGMGVPATTSTTAGEFAEQLARALATPGPTVIDAVLSRI